MRTKSLLVFFVVFVLFSTNASAASLYSKMDFSFSKKISKANRGFIKTHIKGGDSFAQSLITRINGKIKISTSKNASYSFASYVFDGYKTRYALDYSTLHLSKSTASKFLVWHELGHLINYAGIDKQSQRKIFKVFRKSSNWKKCYSLGGGKCVPQAEIFADQVAFYASGVNNVRSGYNVPPLASKKTMKSLLKKYYSTSGQSPAIIR